ncbi:MAG TPA: hypothetical protein VFU30_00020 [Gaiellaceae bacterium]|nr:hypothetical protein [Gaiellaceae bacterium]
MRRLTAWIGGTAVGVAAYRLLRRHPEVAGEPEPAAPDPDTRAEELRAKLAESRVAEPSAEPPVEGAPAVEPIEAIEPDQPAAEEAGGESPGERRRRVHEEGRAALDEMQSE